MSEILKSIKSHVSSKANEDHPDTGQELPDKTVFNPVAEPHLARLRAFLIPGVVNGTLKAVTEQGTRIIDFDNHTERFIPAKPQENLLTKDVPESI